MKCLTSTFHGKAVRPVMLSCCVTAALFTGNASRLLCSSNKLFKIDSWAAGGGGGGGLLIKF